MSKSFFYAVKNGYEPGIYTNWNACSQQVNGFSNAKFKKFRDYSDAVEWLNETPSHVNGTCYAVSNGRRTGIYTTWKECEDQIKFYSNAKYFRFSTLKEAENWLRCQSELKYECK
jgi:ribonuclease HI